jgi:hypothetical protein
MAIIVAEEKLSLTECSVVIKPLFGRMELYTERCYDKLKMNSKEVKP